VPSVIASEAKQSSFKWLLVDCFVALLLAMTVSNGSAPLQLWIGPQFGIAKAQ
jgi:hypothetical protein